MSENCAYCQENELLDAFGIKIRELAASKVYLFKEQSHRGRVIVAAKKHVSEIVDLKPVERRAFLDDVATVAAALHRLFKPAKVNYGAYGDTGCHLHFHLVPKYREDEFEWGGTFAMNPKRTFLSEAEYADLVAKISAELLLAESGGLREALVKLRREIADDGRIDFNESTLLEEALAPYAEGDRAMADLLALLREMRSDGVLTADESAQLIAAFDRVIG